ncbi:hypothetical protein ACH47X_08185 [Promicromonospora kroppenstedtii]|uniref:Uncharacterized protein n=1 Tax=Promicromonospora kroppenstedtii TaxID=440482 RepID=A0ABW7XHP9_9MICO
MSAGADLALPPEYARWQERLAHEFFDGREGLPIVMFVDRDELSLLSDPGTDPVRSLSSAVKQLVRVNQGPSMFSHVLRQETAWLNGPQDKPPPTLPVLALSVLAASEMRSDASGASHNYYIRFSRALLPDGPDDLLESVRYALRGRGSFANVAGMWQRLDRWLGEQQGRFGNSTIPVNPPRSRIGFPLSQALVRRSDRAALTRFFDRLDMRGTGTPSPTALLELLKVWTHNRARGFSDRFVEVLEDPGVQDYLRPLVHDLATAWDGKVITADGLRRLEFRLALDLDRGKAWWVIPTAPGASSDLLEGSTDGVEFTVLVTPDPYSSMFETEGMPPVGSEALTRGLKARGSLCMAEFQPRRLLVMTDNADAGGWTSVDAIQAYEEHVFVVAPEVVSVVEGALAVAADPGWRRMDDGIATEMLHNYAIYYGVTFSNANSLEQAVQLLPESLAARIYLGTAVRPRLASGLPLHRNLSRNTYLAGGEPDLELPVGTEPRDVAVVLDGDKHQVFRATMFPVPFSRFGPYHEGTHTIEADGETLVFSVLSGSGGEYEPPGTGGLSWRDGELSSAKQGDVCGALAGEDSGTDVILARRGAVENWLVHRTGQATQLEEPAPPSFAPGVPFMYFEIRRDRGAWLLQKWSKGWHVTRLESGEPAFQTLGNHDRDVWREAAASVRTSDRLWPLYISAWERARER